MRQRPQPDIAEGECERMSGVTAKIGHACLGSAFDCCRPLEGRHTGPQRRERKNGPRHREKKHLVALRAGTMSNCVRSVSSVPRAPLERFRCPAFLSRPLSFLAVQPAGDAVRDHAAWPARFARASAGVRYLQLGAVVSISHSQRRPLPQAHWVRTVHHGLPERLLVPKPFRIPRPRRARLAVQLDREWRVMASPAGYVSRYLVQPIRRAVPKGRGASIDAGANREEDTYLEKKRGSAVLPRRPASVNDSASGYSARTSRHCRAWPLGIAPSNRRRIPGPIRFSGRSCDGRGRPAFAQRHSNP
jgi:hypothetical protein